MLDRLYDQKQKSSFCDLTLFVNNKVVKAHRNVLACGSPYFDSILKHHKVAREHLTVSCTDVEIFNTLINYMYTGRVTVEHANVEELLRLADHFLMTKVVEYCIEFLGTKLSIENCLFTFYLTQRFKLKQLGNLVENWIVTHLNEVCDGQEVLGLHVLELQEFLKNKMFVVSLYKLLQILTDWVGKHIQDREKELTKLLREVSWTNVDHNDIYKHVEHCELYTKSELSLYYFLHTLMQNNLLMSNYQAKYDMLHAKYEQMLKPEDKGEGEKGDGGKASSGNEKEPHASIIVKARNRNRKEHFLKKLMAGLKPSLKGAALRALAKKNKKISLSDYLTDNIDDSDTDEKVGIKCPICFTNINDSLLLEQHLALSHSKDVTYKCGICNFVCQYHGDYLNHMKVHFTGPPFKCDYCDTTTDQIAKLIAHRAKHLEDSVYQCNFCSFKCRVKQNYLSHLKIHTPEKTFKCDQCTKSFRYKHNLETHMLTHSSEKNLSCETCGFHTKFLSHMIAHKRIHAGDIYRCSYPHCKYSTSKKNQLASHAKSHNGLRPHSCGVCGRGFMEKSHLVRHERIHLEEKPFKCSNCDYASSRRDKLKEHFTRHHGENASAKVPYKARPMRNSGSGSGSGSSRSSKQQAAPESSSSSNNANANNTNINFPANNGSAATASTVTQPIGSEIQDLIMHHQNHSTTAGTGNLATLNSNYHHFGDPSDFHHHSHNIQHQILGHNQRPGQHHNNVVNHHMLAARSNHSSATSTAAAVAAAMMLDPRFHHNSTVPYHPTTTPVSMAMAAVQSSQQIQGSAQHTDYPTTLQNCMTLF